MVLFIYKRAKSMINRLYWGDKNTIDTIKRALQADSIVVGSSDTVFGLLANTSIKGFNALNSVKKRFDRPYLVLIGSKKKAFSLLDSAQLFQIEKIVDSCWPGPLTLICRAHKDLPEYMVKNGTIALRMPNHDGLLRLLAHFDALFSTSANITGDPIPRIVGDLDERILKKVDYLVWDEKDEKKVINVVPSTILDCSGQQIKVVREGAYPVEEIEKKSGVIIKK